MWVTLPSELWTVNPAELFFLFLFCRVFLLLLLFKALTNDTERYKSSVNIADGGRGQVVQTKKWDNHVRNDFEEAQTQLEN